MEIFAIISDHIIGFFQNSKNISQKYIHTKHYTYFLVHTIFATQLKLSGLNHK